MKLLLRYQGFEVRRTSAGHLVVVDPDESAADRAILVELLAEADALDALFFPTADDAIEAIDGFIASAIVRP
jgi:hypothetical protein